MLLVVIQHMKMILSFIANSDLILILISFIISFLFVYNYHSGRAIMGNIINRKTIKSDDSDAADHKTDEEYEAEQYQQHNDQSVSSPINIDPARTIERVLSKSLNWNDYNDFPLAIVLQNTGETVKLRAAYAKATPYINGGNLDKSYHLTEIIFKWGWQKNDGSEHMLEYSKYPLELQALHNAGPCVRRKNVVEHDLLTIGYFFDTTGDSRYLSPIVQNLRYIRKPGDVVEIAPFPLAQLLYPFQGSYYSYYGTYTDEPNIIYTKWFIYPERFSVSLRQLEEFRQILTSNGNPMLKNSRFLKALGDRKVYKNVLV